MLFRSIGGIIVSGWDGKPQIVCESTQKVKCRMAQSLLPDSVIERANQFEHSLSYQRGNGERMEVAFIHIPGSEPVLQAALFVGDTNENGEPFSIGPALSVAEVTLRYEFYAKLKAEGLLDVA